MNSTHKLLIVALFGIVHGAIVSLWPTVASADEDSDGFKGLVGCVGCHREPTPLDIRNGVTKFISKTESDKWTELDKHAKAFDLIDFTQNINKSAGEREYGPARDRAEQICQKMKISKLSAAQECLSCHANWLRHQPNAPKTYKEGVTCESCHGPSAKWIDMHYESKEGDSPEPEVPWRKMSVVDKETLGMVDVRNPTKRAQQCLSCHIGNWKDGKVLTHEMYAAGHPPLPSVEIGTFVEGMHPHWMYIREKKSFGLRSEFLTQHLVSRGVAEEKSMQESAQSECVDEFQKSKAVLVGGVMALRTAVKLLADEARARTGDPSEANSTGQIWPELAQFDCAMCHHDLQSPGWRQQRGYHGSPGRPQMRVWPAALVEVSILHVADKATAAGMIRELNGKLDTLYKAFDAKPFGDRGQIIKAGDDLVNWLDAELVGKDDQFGRGKLASTLCGEDRASDSLHHLKDIARDQTLDYDSARQIAWAYRTISSELAVRDRNAIDIVATCSALADVDKQLKLGLPTGKDRAGLDRQITRELGPWLTKVADYDPVKFKKSFEKLPLK